MGELSEPPPSPDPTETGGWVVAGTVRTAKAACLTNVRCYLGNTRANLT
jgi:hypothetical protein